VIDILRARRQEGEREEGFTLIELMVVVLIIAILLAIAIPTFLGARKRANDRAAQSSLRNSLTAAKTIYTDSQNYTLATPSELNNQEPNISHVAAGTASTGFKEVSVATTTDSFSAAAKSAGGNCFYIKEDATGTKYGASSSDACTGTQASTSASGAAW
jgi:type IV pilus assembly protein PilA